MRSAGGLLKGVLERGRGAIDSESDIVAGKSAVLCWTSALAVEDRKTDLQKDQPLSYWKFAVLPRDDRGLLYTTTFNEFRSKRTLPDLFFGRASSQRNNVPLSSKIALPLHVMEGSSVGVVLRQLIARIFNNV